MAKIARKRADIALGSWEAAAVLGIHFTRPARMLSTGKLIGRTLAGVRDEPQSEIAIYSSADCERDFEEYEERVDEAGGKHYRRPRAWLHLREPVLRRLAREKNLIDYADACSVAEAMEELRLVSTAQVCRMLREGKLIGRRPYSERNNQSKSLWIISRRSVEEWKKSIIAREAAGVKPGLRKFVTKK